MTILKSEEEFLEQLKEWKKSDSFPPELVKFLEQVYASKLYYQYYNKFLGPHYQTTIDQFTQLAQNPKSKAAQLRAALEIACSDIGELHMQLEDYRQEEESENDLGEIASIARAAWEQNSVTKVLCGLNLFATGALILLHIFL